MPAMWGLRENHLGSGQQRDMDHGPFSPVTGGLDLTPTGEPPSACEEHNAYVKYLDKVNLMTDYLKSKNTDRLWTCFTKAG